MRIGVVSDTHSLPVPQQVFDDFKNVDLIVHAGDFCAKSDLNVFKKIAKVKGVFGNMDGLEIRQVLPETDIIDADGIRIGICHGHGPAAKVPGLVQSAFKGKKVRVVIFGHSHLPYNETVDGVLYFNPGSPNDIVRAPYCSYGILDINNGKVDAKIVKVK